MTPDDGTCLPPAARIPAATYRLQFNSNFTLATALEMADYLRELGISDCYASPLFRAGPQSTHGYDACGFDQFSPALGGLDGFEHFSSRLHELELGLLLDMVPNHMGADLSNAWWRDVLERGRSSPFGGWFDIDWESDKPGLRGKVLLPVLEDHYAKVLEAGKLKMVFEDGAPSLTYYDWKFPLAPPSAARLLKWALSRCSEEPDSKKPARELDGLIETLGAYEGTRGDVAALLNLKQKLHRASHNFAAFQSALADTLQHINGKPGHPKSFNELHSFLQQQHYRLAYWRVAAEEINYRRFFDVTELVSLRMELPEVFQATHGLVLDLIRKGKVTGLRIDHPDGLWDPKQYFERLRSSADRPLYIVAEKILSGDEHLPEDWPVAGTTGYDFLNEVNGLFVNRAHLEGLEQVYRDFTQRPAGWTFSRLANQSKKRILQTSMLSDLNSLARLLHSIAARTRYGQDFPFRQIQAALTEVIAAFPVYRTYVTEERHTLSWIEKDCVAQAIRGATTANPSLDPAVVALVQDLLLLRPAKDLDEEGLQASRRFVMTFQQLTGPATAKGIEDTAFYNFHRLISLNEVGGDPETFGVGVHEFHERMLARAQHWPHSLLATATHDTKRGEDVRARINVLSEIPGEWRKAVTRWAELNADKKSLVNGEAAPDKNDEFLLYQTLLGTWEPTNETPAGLATFRERITHYMLKATKEAKTHTTWTEPNSAYEEAARHFVESLLLDIEPNLFLEDFRPLQRKTAFFGRFNSLSQVLLKMTAPGVADFYQGTELWDLNLVDPDNRRPVDFAGRQALLHRLKARLDEKRPDLRPVLTELLQRPETGEIKLYVIWQILNFRHQHRDLFDRGEYIPLSATGAKKEHLCAFARRWEGDLVVVVAPRLILRLVNGLERPPTGKEIWVDTSVSIPNTDLGQQYRNILTGEILAVADPTKGLPLGAVLDCSPVALLQRL
jgi:(1->4)-alpha-D-glucan 1-alpha-D-glucosylmutase